MVDHFVLLQEPRRPWIDPDELKEKFLTLSAELHPDRMHNASEEERCAANQRFTQINAAYNCLRVPKDRLLHLLDLERGAKPKDLERIPPGARDLFFQIGQACRQVDSFLADKSKVTSPLLQVQWFEKGLEWIDRLNVLQQTIRAERQQVFDELKAMNAQWESAPEVTSAARPAALPLNRLEEIYRVVSYLSRWTEQIQERIVQLSL